MGEIILEQGVLKNDQLSYTMPSYEFVDFHWLSNVLIYLGYTYVGRLGLAAIFALLVVVIIRVLMPMKEKKLSLLGVLLAATILLNRAGIRPQIESWFLFSILLAWLLNDKLWQKLKWAYPVYMLIWANLHGGFFVGWGLLSLKVIIEFIQTRKVILSDILILFLGVTATLINPYGWKLWYAVWKLLSDPITKTNISEWLPFYFHFEMAIFLLATLLLVFGKQELKGITKWLIVLTAGLFVSAIISLRNAPFFVLAGIPLLTQILSSFYQRYSSKGGETKRRLNIFMRIIYGVFVFYFCLEVVSNLYGLGINKDLSDENLYPKKAIEYLDREGIAGNLFTLYHWSGYMEWKMPKVKQFVDGRMPEWRYGVWPLTNEKPPVGESGNAFLDYIKILDKLEYEELFEKFNVRTVMIDKKPVEIKRDRTILALIEKVLGKNKEKEKTIYEKLEEDGWKKVYEDNVAWVYKHEDK